MTKSKVLVFLFLSVFIVGAIPSGAFAWAINGTAVTSDTITSGAADYKVYLDKTSTSLGGDSVNVAINVLNGDGAVNTVSNGQTGDVLFVVQTQLGRTAWADTLDGDAIAPNVPDGLINDENGDGFYNTAGDSLTGFAADIDQYLQPRGGLALGNIFYGTVSGTDTIVVKAYESVTAGGAVNPSQVVPGKKIGEVSFTVEVAAGTTTVTAINSVYVGNGDGLAIPRVAANTGDTQAGNGFVLEKVHGVIVNGDGNPATANDVVGAEAGVNFGLHVNAPQNQNGDVKVGFYKIADLFFAGAVTPTARSQKRPPTEVAVVDVTLADGLGDVNTNLTSSGYYIVVVYVERDDGSVLEVPMVNAGANVVLLRVDPVGVPGGSPVLGKVGLSADRNLLKTNTANHPVSLTVIAMDTYGNRTYLPTAKTVGFTGSTAVGPAAQLPVNTSTIGYTTITTPNTTAPMSVTAEIDSIKSDPVTFMLGTGNGIGFAGGAVTDLKVLDRANDGGTVDINAGSVVTVCFDNALGWAHGTQLYAKLTGSGETATAALDTSKLEPAATDPCNDTNNGDDYIVDFTFTQTTGASDIIIGVQSGVTPLPVPVRVLSEAGTDLVAGGADGVTLANDYDAGDLRDFTGIVVAGTNAGATYKLIDWRGKELYIYSAGGAVNNIFQITGDSIQVADAYGNAVGPVAAGGSQFVTAISTNFASSMSVNAGGSNVAEYAPAAAATMNALGLNAGLTYGYVGAGNEIVQFNVAAGDTGDDTLKFTNNSSIDLMEVTILNIGAPYTQIRVSSVDGTTTEVTMPQNGAIPMVVETLNDAGSRTAAGANDLLLEISNTTISVWTANGGAQRTTGFQFGGAARFIYMVTAGNQTGSATIKVTQAGGTIESNTLTVNVAAIAPDTPVVESVDAGMGSSDPADVTATEDETITLYVYTDIDGYVPTESWVVLSIPGTEFWFVYDETTSAFVPLELTVEGILAAQAAYPFTATGADQQIWTANLPLTGLAGYTFQITFFYTDSEGNLASFDYIITVNATP